MLAHASRGDLGADPAAFIAMEWDGIRVQAAAGTRMAFLALYAYRRGHLFAFRILGRSFDGAIVESC
jgi:hypothetical protein